MKMKPTGGKVPKGKTGPVKTTTPAAMKFSTKTTKTGEERVSKPKAPKTGSANPKVKKGMPPLPIFDVKGKK